MRSVESDSFDRRQLSDEIVQRVDTSLPENSGAVRFWDRLRGYFHSPVPAFHSLRRRVDNTSSVPWKILPFTQRNELANRENISTSPGDEQTIRHANLHQASSNVFSREHGCRMPAQQQQRQGASSTRRNTLHLRERSEVNAQLSARDYFDLNSVHGPIILSPRPTRVTSNGWLRSLQGDQDGSEASPYMTRVLNEMQVAREGHNPIDSRMVVASEQHDDNAERAQSFPLSSNAEARVGFDMLPASDSEEVESPPAPPPYEFLPRFPGRQLSSRPPPWVPSNGSSIDHDVTRGREVLLRAPRSAEIDHPMLQRYVANHFISIPMGYARSPGQADMQLRIPEPHTRLPSHSLRMGIGIRGTGTLRMFRNGEVFTELPIGDGVVVELGVPDV